MNSEITNESLSLVLKEVANELSTKFLDFIRTSQRTSNLLWGNDTVDQLLLFRFY